MKKLAKQQLVLLKYGTQDCSFCRAMHAYDGEVAADLGLGFVDVDLKDPASYRPYRPILLRRFPGKRSLALPTYLLVEDPRGDFAILGEIMGGMPKERFRQALQDLLEPDRAAGLHSAVAAPD